MDRKVIRFCRDLCHWYCRSRGFLISRPLPVVHPPTVDVTDVEEMSLATSPSTVEVMYADWIKSGPGGWSYLRFIIHNGESDPLVYLSGSSTDPEPFIRVNGKEARRPSTCENGLERFYIPPGSSASVLVSDHHFRDSHKPVPSFRSVSGL